MTKNIESTSKHQRRCITNLRNDGCENCEIETCPYIYCQHVECMDCSLRMMCPMCHGECTECEYVAICSISQM